MNKGFHLAWLVFAAAPFANGCFLVSDDIKDDLTNITNDLPSVTATLKIEAIADGSGKTHVDVCSAEGIACTNVHGPFQASLDAGALVDLKFVESYKEKDGTSVGSFQADLPGDKPGSKITVIRAKDDAKTSVVTMTEPAVITAPAADTKFSLATDTIKLTWDATSSEDPLEWTSSAECTTQSSGPETAGTKIDDTGELVIDPAKLNLKAGETCQVTIYLRRWRDGTIESDYNKNGLITSKQIRTITFEVAP